MKVSFLNNHSYIKKSVVSGLFLFILTWGPNLFSQNPEGYMNTVDSVMERYYYSYPDSALRKLDQLYAKYAKDSSRNALMYILLNKTYVAEHHYLIDSLEYYLRESDELLDRNGQSDFVEDFIYMKGMYNYYIGDYDRAIENFKNMIFEDGKLVMNDSMQTYNSLFNLGQLSVYHQDYAGAQQYYELAKNILPTKSETYASVRDHRYEQSFLQMSMTKAEFYRVKDQKNVKYKLLPIAGSFEDALNRIIDKEGEAGANNLFITLYTYLSEIYTALKDLDKAEKAILKAINLSEGGDPERQLKLYFEAAHLQMEMHNYELGENYLKIANNLIKNKLKGKYRFRAKVYYERGNMLTIRKKYKEATKEYQKALSQLIYKNDRQLEIHEHLPLDSIVAESEILKVLLYKADALAKWYESDPKQPGNVITAIETYQDAFEVMDRIRIGFQNEESKLFISSMMSPAFENSINACYKAYKNSSDNKFIKQAFQFAEQHKTNQLLEMVKDLTSKSFNHIPPNLIEGERRLKGRIFYWKEAIINGDDNNEDSYQQLLESQMKYEDFVHRIENDYPEYYKLKYARGYLEIQEIQSEMLNDQTALIEYFYGKDELYAFGISRDSMMMTSLSLGNDFEEKISKFVKALKSPDSKGYEENARYLYQKLLKPLNNILPEKEGKMLIIPDGKLDYLSFEALMRSTNENSHFLIQDFTVGYDYSARLFKEKSKLINRNVKYSYLGFAPDYDGSPSSSANRKINVALKYNRDEVITAQEEMGGKVFINEEATENNFYSYAENARLLHLSMHAFADDKYPSRSAFYFVEEDSTNMLNRTTVFDADGALHVYEIYNLLLKADLAVLSACETGGGEVADGEGIMSMGRAFQYAGCPSVVMSLWQINDKSTASIMNGLFKNLNKGMNKAEALRQAKLNFLNHPDNKFFSHPYYWSAFILMGDPEPITSSTNYLGLIMFFSFGAVVLIILILLRKSRKN